MVVVSVVGGGGNVGRSNGGGGPLVHRLARLISSLAIDISEELVERLLPLGLFLRGVSEMEWEKKCA